MKIRRKYNSTGITSLSYDVAKNETTNSCLFRVKIQINFLVWITIKTYYIHVILEKIIDDDNDTLEDLLKFDEDVKSGKITPLYSSDGIDLYENGEKVDFKNHSWNN